jgi:hypothetical protein
MLSHIQVTPVVLPWNKSRFLLIRPLLVTEYAVSVKTHLIGETNFKKTDIMHLDPWFVYCYCLEGTIYAVLF